MKPYLKYFVVTVQLVTQLEIANSCIDNVVKMFGTDSYNVEVLDPSLYDHSAVVISLIENIYFESYYNQPLVDRRYVRYVWKGQYEIFFGHSIVDWLLNNPFHSLQLQLTQFTSNEDRTENIEE